MGNLRSDSPICRRVVFAFLDFLKSVEPAPGVDLEALDVVRECLAEVFKLNLSSSDDEMQPGVLINLFTSWEDGEQCKSKQDLGPAVIENKASITTSSKQIEDSCDSEASNVRDQAGVTHVLGLNSKDELFGKFYAALDKINFFETSAAGVEDPAKVAKASEFFNDALREMEDSQGQVINLTNLAETFKLKGNRSMQLKLYSEAIELYTCAIALWEKNAVYYCNRAAAYTQIERYSEAIGDCLKSTEIDPSYSKAYSRLGLAYYAQGNYSDALNKGFLKALELDPRNEAVKENIWVANQKLMEQHVRTGTAQNIGSSHGEEPTTQSSTSTDRSTPVPSFPFSGAIPPELLNMFRGVASAAQGQEASERTGGGNSEESPGPENRMHANVSFNFGEAVPEQLSDALRSVMGMFSAQQGPQRNGPRDGDGDQTRGSS